MVVKIWNEDRSPLEEGYRGKIWEWMGWWY